MMIHPQFDPILLSIGPLAIRWYALSYIVGFVLFIWLGRRRIAEGNTVFTKEMLDDFLTWGVIGVILGGRLGYVLFYKFSDYLAHPLDILKVWEGGMSFHGGFLGVLVAMCCLAASTTSAFGKWPTLWHRSCLWGWLRGASAILSTANCGAASPTSTLFGRWAFRRRVMKI